MLGTKDLKFNFYALLISIFSNKNPDEAFKTLELEFMDKKSNFKNQNAVITEYDIKVAMFLHQNKVTYKNIKKYLNINIKEDDLMKRISRYQQKKLA